MPFAFEVLHLASGKRVHNLAKRKNFLFGSQPLAGFKWSGSPSDVEKYTHYKFKIVHHKGEDKESQRARENHSYLFLQRAAGPLHYRNTPRFSFYLLK